MSRLFTRTADVTAATAIGTSYDAAKAAVVQVATSAPGLQFSDIYLVVRIDTIAGASAVTCVVTSDEDGDVTVLPDATATLSTGLTTATSGVAAFYAEVPFVAPRDGVADKWYVHVKSDAGTFNVSAVEIYGKVH